jgi:hypothetical protein
MNHKLISLITIFFITTSAISQKYNFNKVTVEELAEKVHPMDSSAAAALLFKTGKVSFELSFEGTFTLVQEVKTKIKIYNKEGYSFANVEIPYYTGGQSVRLFFDDAATYNLVDNKVERTKLKSDGEFQEKVNENYSLKKITLPNVKEGSIIEFKYTLKTPYFNFLPDWYFQYSIPVNNIQYEVLIPQYFSYQRFLKGFEQINASDEEVVLSTNGRYNNSRIIYTGSNIKAIKEEPYVNNMDNYTSMIQYELASTNFPSNGIVNYSTDWESVAKTIYESEYFGREVAKTSYYEADLEELIKGKVSRGERITAIFDFVKNRMNWNEKMGYYTDLGVKKAYTEKVGNVADINLMLVSMLREAQIKCNPVLVSTRSNGISVFPNRGAYNYVIAGIELDKEIILLDATTKNALPNILPIEVLNWKGRIIRENKTSSEVDLMPKVNSKETITVLANMDENGKVSGKIRDQYFDYNGYLFRENNLSKSKDSYLESMEKRYPGLVVGAYVVTNEKELTKPIVETIDFTNDNVSERIGDKIYFNPMLHFATKVNPFKQEKRDYPLDFAFPYQDKYSITINIPEGYAIESLPKPLAIGMEQNIANFIYNIVANGNQIQLAATVEINYSTIAPDQYASLKMYYKEMIDKQNEKVVLKKL